MTGMVLGLQLLLMVCLLWLLASGHICWTVANQAEGWDHVTDQTGGG